MDLSIKALSKMNEVAQEVARLRLWHVGCAGALTHQLVELEKRTKQMAWLLPQIVRENEMAYRQHFQTAMAILADDENNNEVLDLAMTATFAVETWTEAFYLFGFRAIDLARKMPQLKGFEPKGVREVRNHLIVHPDKTSGVFIQSFSHGGDGGPALKVARSAEDEEKFMDPGLWTNAIEFADDLLPLLRVF